MELNLTYQQAQELVNKYITDPIITTTQIQL